MAAKKRTTETKVVETAFRLAGFKNTEAYRQNRACIKIRVVDKRFNGMTLSDRDDMAEPVLRSLPEEIQQDIMVLLLLSPRELRNSLANMEFEHPVPSMLS